MSKNINLAHISKLMKKLSFLQICLMLISSLYIISFSVIKINRIVKKKNFMCLKKLIGKNQLMNKFSIMHINQNCIHFYK